MKFIVVDIQGFRIPHFIPKEVTFLSVKHHGHFTFKPPTPFHELDSSTKTQVRWLEQNHHGIKYSEGLVQYEDVHSIFKKLTVDQDVDVIYVQGKEKKDFIYDILRYEDHKINIIDLSDNSDVPNVKKIKSSCLHHFKPYHVCSFNNCKILYDWIMNLLPKSNNN